MANWWDDWKVPDSVTPPSPTLPTPGSGAQALLPSSTPLAPSLPNPPSFADTLEQYRARQQQDVEKWLRPESTPSLPAPPQPASTWQTLKDIGGGVLETIRGIPAVVGSSMESIANPYAERDWKDSVIESGRQRQQADLQALHDAGEYDRPMGLGMPFTRGEWAETTQSFPYTAATMLPALAGGAVGTAIGGAIGGLGGPVAPATVPAGAAVGRAIGGTLGGMLGSYFPAGGAAANQFIRDSLDKYQQDFTKENGREPTPEEIDAYYKATVEPQAGRIYHGESAPEAVGTVAELGLMKSAIGDILESGGSLPVRIAKAGAKTALSAFGVEPLTETITQQIQQPAYAATGLTDEAPRSMTSPEDWLKSAGEVYKQAAATSLFFSALGIPAGSVYGRYQSRREGNARVDQATQATDTLRANLDVANEQDIAQALAGFDQVEAQGQLPKAAAARLEQARQQLTQELALRASPEALAEPLETARGRAGYLGLSERADSLSDEQLAQAANRPLPQDAAPELVEARQRYGSELAKRQQMAQVADQLQDPDAAKIMEGTLGRIISGKPMAKGGYGSVDFNLASLSDDMLERYRLAADVLARAGKPSQTATKAADALNQEAERRASGQRRDPESIRLSETASKVALAPEAKMAAMLKGISTEGLDRIAGRLNELATTNPLLADKARAVLERVRTDRMQRFNPEGEQQPGITAALRGWNQGQVQPAQPDQPVPGLPVTAAQGQQTPIPRNIQNPAATGQRMLADALQRQQALKQEVAGLNQKSAAPALPTPPQWGSTLGGASQPLQASPQVGPEFAPQPLSGPAELTRLLGTNPPAPTLPAPVQPQGLTSLADLLGRDSRLDVVPPSVSAQGPVAPTAPTPRLPEPPNVQTRQTAQQAAPSVGVPTGPEGARGARAEGTGTAPRTAAGTVVPQDLASAVRGGPTGRESIPTTATPSQPETTREKGQTEAQAAPLLNQEQPSASTGAVKSDKPTAPTQKVVTAASTGAEAIKIGPYVPDFEMSVIIGGMRKKLGNHIARRIESGINLPEIVGDRKFVVHGDLLKPNEFMVSDEKTGIAITEKPSSTAEEAIYEARKVLQKLGKSEFEKQIGEAKLKDRKNRAGNGAVQTPAKKPSRASKPAPSWNDSTRSEREAILKDTGASDEFAKRKANEWPTWDAIPEGPIKKRIRDVLADRAEEVATPADQERDKLGDIIPSTVQPRQKPPASTANPSKAIETPAPAPQPQPKQETPNESIVRPGKDRQGISGPGIQPGGGTAKGVGYGSPVQRPLFGQPRPISDLIAEGFAQPVESVEGLLSQYDETTTDGETVSRIEINTDTVQAHLDAMDAALGDTLPGMEERPRLEGDLSIIPADQEEQDDDLPGGAWIATLSRNPNLSVRITTVEVDEASELASPPPGVPLIYGQITDKNGRASDISLYIIEGGQVKFGLVDAIEQANAILKTRWAALTDKIGQANTSAEQTLDRYFSDPNAKVVYILRTKDGQALMWSQSRRDMERRIDPENPVYADATVERMTAQAWRDRKTEPTVPAPKAAVPSWAQAAATLVDEQRDAYENAIRHLAENEKILTATNDALRGARRGTKASQALSKKYNDALRAKESYDRLITQFELAALALDESVPEWKRVVAAMRLFSLTREKDGFLSEPQKVKNYPADLREKFAVLAKEANGGKVFSKQTLERVAQRFLRPSSIPEYDFARSTLRNSWPDDEFTRTVRVENRADLFAPIAEERAIKPLQAMREDALDQDINQLINEVSLSVHTAANRDTTVPEFEAEMDALVERGKEAVKEREAEAKRRAEQAEKDKAAQRAEQAALVARWEAPLPEKTKDANGNKITIEYPTGVGPVRLVPVPLKVKQSDSPIKALVPAISPKDDFRYYLTQVHVDSKNVVATNGHVLVAVPNSSAIEEGFYDPKTLAKNESAAGWKYPDYERVIPNDKDASTYTRGVLLDELIAIVNAAVRGRSFLANKSQREDETSFILRVSGMPENFGFDAKVMLQALSALKAATGAEAVTVRTSLANKDLIALKITDEKSGALAVIMPRSVSKDSFTYVPVDLNGLTHEVRRSVPSTATPQPATVSQKTTDRDAAIQALDTLNDRHDLGDNALSNSEIQPLVEYATEVRASSPDEATFISRLVSALGEKVRRWAKALWEYTGKTLVLIAAINIATPTNININPSEAKSLLQTELSEQPTPIIQAVQVALTENSKPVTAHVLEQATRPVAVEVPSPIAPANAKISAKDRFQEIINTAREMNQKVKGSAKDADPQWQERANAAIAKVRQGKRLTAMEVAWTMYGEHEYVAESDDKAGRPSSAAIQKVLDYFGSKLNQDKYPWCAPFMSYVHARAGIALKIQSARAFLRAGNSINVADAKEGDILVMRNSNPDTGGWDGYGGHVAFIVKRDGDMFWGLGGNQNDEVNVTIFHSDRILGVRRITEKAIPAEKNKSAVSKRFSRAGIAEVEPATVAQARATLVKALGEKHVTALERAGRLMLHEKDPTKTGAAGYVDGKGVIHLIPANMDQTALDIALHEAMHLARDDRFSEGERAKVRLAHAALRLAGLKNFIGNPGFNDLVQQVRRMAAEGNKTAQDALAKARLEDPNNIDEEAIAYLAQYADEKLPLVRRILAAIRAALYRMGIKINLTPADVRALALSALKNQARRAANAVQMESNARQEAFSLPDFAPTEADKAEVERQMKAVKEVRDAKGRLLAPNGKPSKLNERQWKQVRTQFFKDWFGDFENDPENASKVVDENGEPKIMLHGSLADFNIFQKTKGTVSTIFGNEYVERTGFFFTDDREFASAFGSPMETYLNIREPFDMRRGISEDMYQRAEEAGISGRWLLRNIEDWERFDEEDGRLFVENLQTAQYDGAAFMEDDNNGYPVNVFVAFRPGQIKSALGNAGTFSNRSNRIDYSQPTATEDAAEQDRLWAEFQAVRAQFQARQPSETAFKRWFGKGTEGITARDGQPITLYHGTNNPEFNRWDEGRAGQASDHPTSGLGFFLTADRRSAARYGSRLMELNARINKPYYMTDADLTSIETVQDATRFRKKLLAHGYDGAVITAPGGAPYVVALESKQVKYTTNTNPTDSEDFRYSRPNQPSLAHPREAAKVLGDIGELRDTLKPGEKLLSKLNPANWRQMLSDLKANTRPQWLGLLTQDHLLELARTQFPANAVRQFDDASEKLDAYENRMIQSEGWPLADRWQTLARQARAQADALGRALYMSTWLGVDPRAASAPKGKLVEWTRAKAALAALTHPEARRLYDDVLKFYADQTERLFKELEARIQRHSLPEPDKLAARDLLRQEFERMKDEGPYAPLMRFGDLTVWADPIKPGEKPIFATLETVQDQRAFADWLKRAGYQPRLGVKMEEITKRALPAGDVVGKLAGLVDKNIKGPQADVLKDAMYQLFLRSLPEQAIRKHFIHRKFVPGYSGDALRTYATFARRSAKQIARLAHGDRMGSALDDMAKAVREGTVDDAVAAGHLVNELDQSYQWTMNPQTADWASRLTHLGFMFHLAGSPAHLLLNLSQQAQITLPWLAGELHGKKGFTGVAAALGKANLDFLRTNPFTDPANRGQHAQTMRAQMEGEYGGDLGKALKALEEAGKTDKSQTYSVSGMSSEDQFLWSKPWLRKATAALGWFFHASEVINREATAIATYRLGRDAGMNHDAAYDLARRAINETHYEYSPSNRARFMRGNTAKVITLFKQYSLNTSWQLGRNAVLAMRGASAEEKSVARTKLAGMLGMTAVMAGAVGMPFYNDLAWMLTQLMTAFGDDDEPEWDFDTWFRQTLDHALTPKGSEAVRRGLINAFAGVDVSSRVKLDDLWWRRLDDDLHGKQMAYAMMEQALGPVAGLAVRSISTVDGLWDALIEGTSARGASARTLEAAMPTVLKSIGKSLRFAQEGATTATGAPLVSREELGISGILGQGIGFTPAALTERQAKNTAMLALQDKIERRRRAILDIINIAVWQGDRDVIAAMQDDIQKFNKRYPSDAITGDTIQKSIEAGARRRLELQLFGGAPLNKKLAPMLLSGGE